MKTSNKPIKKCFDLMSETILRLGKLKNGKKITDAQIDLLDKAAKKIDEAELYLNALNQQLAAKAAKQGKGRHV